MAGLKTWFKQNWVDIGSKRKDGSFAKRKRAAFGGSMSPTSDKRNSPMNNMMKEAQRNYKGSFIKGSLGGIKVSNPSYMKYYGRKVMP